MPNGEAPNPAQTPDSELQAIQALIQALTPLDAPARDRVVAYVFGRFGIAVPTLAGTGTVTPGAAAPPPPPLVGSGDIRSLKEAKQPRNAIEMAVLVAYYLSEVAPEGMRKEGIGTEDLRKFFKQAGYPLPTSPRQTLFGAKHAGYLDSAARRGVYKLSPVGHNLIAHGLPRKAK